MLVKVDKNFYINTEHVRSVYFYGDKADITLSGDHGDHREDINVSAIAAAHLLSLMEADSSAILPGEDNFLTENLKLKTTRPLTSRIAELLRDEFTQGASVEDLMSATDNQMFHEVYNAISDLLAERVAVSDPAQPLRYYHAQHRPGKPAPETEAGALMVNALRQGELQCIECQHQSCATCVTANACCKCNQPAFTAYLAPLHIYDTKSAYPSDLPKQILAPCCLAPMSSVFYNPINEVVQCHGCGAVWTVSGNPYIISENLKLKTNNCPSSNLDLSVVNAEWE